MMPGFGDAWTAAAAGRRQVLSDLIKSHPEYVTYRNPSANHSTLLHNAAQEGDEVMVAALLENGADVNAQNDFGETPLHEASKWGRAEVVTLLLESGADVTAHDNDGCTPLSASTHVYVGEHPLAKAVQKLLLDADAGESMTIHDAVWIGDLGRVEAMLDEDPSILENRDADNYTPLLNAAATSRMDLAEFLLAKGADIDAADQFGHTPLLLAIEGEDKHMAAFFRQRGAWEPEEGWFQKPKT